MAALAYKKNFQSTPALQLFYSGGPVRLAPDGSYVACACSDEIKFVEISSGTLNRTLSGDSELITSIVISPNGKSLFSASRSLQVKHWDLSTDTILRSWKAHEGPVPDMAMDATGGFLATASADKTVRVWDVDGGFCTHSFKGHTGVVTRVIFHPDPHRLLVFSGGDDATVRVWDMVTKQCLAVFDKHFSVITSLAVSTNGWSLLTGARDKVVNMWSLRDYSHEITVPVYEAIEAVCIIPDGCDLPGSAIANPVSKKKHGKPRFLTVGENGIIRVFSTEGANCLYKQQKSDVSEMLKDESKRGFSEAFILPDLRGVLCITVDHRLLFYEAFNTDDGQRDLRVNKRLIGFSDEITDLRFIGEHESMLAVASNVEQIRLYDIATMTCTTELTGHSDIVLCLDSCISAAGRPILASGGKDNTLRLWDIESGSCIAMAAGHMAAVGAVAFSKKQRNFVVSGSRDRTIKLWNLDVVLNAGFPDIPLKLSSQAVVAAHEKDINSVAVAPNDSLICSGSQDATARIWKLPELTPVWTLRGHKRGVWSVEFSTVDQCVLTASGDKTIRIWSLSDGSCLKTFEGHTASVLKASFLTQGTQIISAGADGLLKLWTIRNTECINTFDVHTDKIWALAVGPKSERLASGGADSMVVLWTDCTATDEEEAATKEAEEVLKDQELSNALADTDYEKAIQLGFELRRPYKLLKVFTELFKAGGDSHVHAVLSKLDKEYLHLLLEYVREWNSKSKFCYVAQCVLQHLFVVFPPAELTKVSGVTELLEGILPYSQRHFNRIDRLARSCFVLDYTLACMSVLTPMETNSTFNPVLDSNSFQPVGMKSYWDHQSGVDDNDTSVEQGLVSGEPNLVAEGPMVSEVEEHIRDTSVEAGDDGIPRHTNRQEEKKRHGDELHDASVHENGKKKRKKSFENGATNNAAAADDQQVQQNGFLSNPKPDYPAQDGEETVTKTKKKSRKARKKNAAAVPEDAVPEDAKVATGTIPDDSKVAEVRRPGSKSKKNKVNQVHTGEDPPKKSKKSTAKDEDDYQKAKRGINSDLSIKRRDSNTRKKKKVES